MNKKKLQPAKKPAKSRTASRRCAVSPGSAPLTFEQGYICAVANLLRDHDAHVHARDLLAGVPCVDWSTIDPYDRDEIAKHGLLPNAAYQPRRGDNQ